MPVCNVGNIVNSLLLFFTSNKLNVMLSSTQRQINDSISLLYICVNILDT